MSAAGARPVPPAVARIDAALQALSAVFLVLANACLVLMLLGTAATIVLRPLNVSYYWIWPWTMQFFVWMTFIGFYVVYRQGKDIAVDFVVMRLGSGAMAVSRLFVAAVVMLVMGAILWQMPTILRSQVGVIDGVMTPWGELERYSLSVPLAVSCALILVNSGLDIAKALVGVPERVASHAQDPDS